MPRDPRPVKHIIAGIGKAIKDASIVANPGEDVDEKLSETAIGVGLDVGKFQAPHAKKLWTSFLGLTHLIGIQPLTNTTDL